MAIDSEAETLPVGDVRRYWALDALKRADAEREPYENQCQTAARDAAIRLVERFAWAVEAQNERRQHGGDA